MAGAETALHVDAVLGAWEGGPQGSEFWAPKMVSLVATGKDCWGAARAEVRKLATRRRQEDINGRGAIVRCLLK